MQPPEQNSACKKANNREEGVINELVPSISTLQFSEVDNEFVDEEHNSSDKLEDEDEKDPNDIVHKRAATVTAALKQQFSSLFNNSRYPDYKVLEWKETHRSKKCECCNVLGLPCTSSLRERKLVCQECNKTSARKCSRLNDFRKEFIMKRMGIDEDLWQVLKEAYLEDKSQKTMQSWTEKARRMEEAEDQGKEEEDELDSGVEVASQEIATSTKRVLRTHNKQKSRTTDDEEPTSSSILDAPPAKKGKNKPQVVIDICILRNIKSGEHKNLKAAGRKNKVKRPGLPTKKNDNRVEQIRSNVSGNVEPAIAGDTMSSSKRPLLPTGKASQTGSEWRKRRKVAEKDISSDSGTHAHVSSIGLPIATAAIGTNSVPPGAITGAEATSSGNVATTNIVHSRSLVPASVSDLTKMRVPSIPTEQTTSVPPKLNQNTPNAVKLPPHLPPQGQAKAQSPVLPPHPIPPELSLSVLKHALEDISSDLRYNRIDIPSAMAKFDEVADRIGRRADLCVVSGMM
ncbi:hypothetical protein PM082_004573 [Marasmius tenuissimus]|nr:hypothetical protein PM082_004573 [Marasmius tenuissimus]